MVCTKKIGLNVNNAKHLETFVSNLIPKNLQYGVFSGFMSTGIFLSNKLLIGNLKRHLEKRDSYIKLVFPYLDYGLNFLFSEKNIISLYEKNFKREFFIQNTGKGNTLPNINLRTLFLGKENDLKIINENISSREFISKENEKESKILIKKYKAVLFFWLKTKKIPL